MATPTQAQAQAQAPARPFITCHVLETVSGRPAPNMRVTLSLLSPLPSSTSTMSKSFTATTNTDGRVTSWEPTSTSTSTSSSNSTSSTNDLNTLVSTLKTCIKNNNAGQEHQEPEQMKWSLVFQTEEFYGKGKTFWPEVELKFCAGVDEAHYHVPLLLGPWSYTTYRGS